MISLRSHAISLIAVFLALVAGAVLGSGVLSDTVLSSMRNEKRDLYSRVGSLTDQNNTLNQKLSAANSFDRQVLGRIVHGALTDKAVIVFRTPDAKDDDVAAVTSAVGQAGGAVVGVITFTQEFVEANSTEKLNTVVSSIGLPVGSQLNPSLVDQGSRAGDVLGLMLLINPAPGSPVADDTQRDTALAALRETGFISYQLSPPAAAHLAPAHAALVITGGALPVDAGNQGATVARFAAALAPHGAATLLAGRDGSAEGTAAVAVIRNAPGLAAVVSTVDDVDAEPGRITAILGLHDLLGGTRPAQYGTGKGATSVTVAQ